MNDGNDQQSPTDVSKFVTRDQLERSFKPVSESIHERFNDVEHQVDSVESRVEEVARRADQFLHGRFWSLKNRYVDALERALEETGTIDVAPVGTSVDFASVELAHYDAHDEA